MACAVFAYGNARVGCADFYVGVGVAYGVSNLLEASACRKHCECGREGNLSAEGHTYGNADEVVFCYTAVKESVGERFLEYAGLCSSREVSVKYNEIVVNCAEFGKRFTVCFTGSNFICHEFYYPFDLYGKNG